MYRVCIDIGGTFTDAVMIDSEGKISEYKVPTTPVIPHNFQFKVDYIITWRS